jgi:hypothetical protein
MRPVLVRSFVLALAIELRQIGPRGGLNARASLVKKSLYVSPVSRRTMLRKAAFASSVVASIASVFPLTSPAIPRHCNTHVNTNRWVSKSINRRVRDIVE